MNGMRIALLAAIVTMGVAGPLGAAQEQTGVLQGRAFDSSGLALPGVTVTISGATILGGSRTTVTGETGIYRIQAIPIGVYRVTFELAGFQTKIFEEIRVLVGATFTLELPKAAGGAS